MPGMEGDHANIRPQCCNRSIAHTLIKRDSCCVRKRTLVQLKCLITERMPNASPSELGNTLKKLGNLVLSLRISEYTEPVICRKKGHFVLRYI